jgi:hypothetical protein
VYQRALVHRIVKRSEQVGERSQKRTMPTRSIALILDWTEDADWLAPPVMRLFFGYWIINGWTKINDLQDFAQRFAG